VIAQYTPCEAILFLLENDGPRFEISYWQYPYKHVHSRPFFQFQPAIPRETDNSLL